MKILRSQYLSDGKGFNDGRPVDLIRIEREEDFDALLDHILKSGYYDSAYFREHISYEEDRVKFDAFFLSAMIRLLRPQRILEVGCGRGDVLALLAAKRRLHLCGVEFSPDILAQTWPHLKGKLERGDVRQVCGRLASVFIRFDTFCAFDFWEHLLPRRLDEYIEALVALAEKDALFFFTIPAFGEDRIFGEIFPLEVEENRDRFERRLPFLYLNAESIDPPIPAQGHLIWAHSEWWEKQFRKHGLIRLEELEKRMHRLFDEHLFYARKSFYLFSLDTPQARRRVQGLLRKGPNYFRKWKIFVDLTEEICRLEESLGGTLIDQKELKATVHHAEVEANTEVKGRIERWIWGTAERKGQSGLLGPLRLFLEHWAYRFWEGYLTRYKRRRYPPAVG